MTNTAQVMSTVCVDNIQIPVTVYQNNRVITTELLAQVYGTATTNIKQNFNNNQDRFEEGKHYFKLEGEALRIFKKSLGRNNLLSQQAKHFILWTERGAARHAKMLGTDQAWDVFDKLEAAYFEQPAATPSQELPQPEKPKAQKLITLTQAELDALINERVAKAIPPSLEFPPEVLAAIESRAQALSLRHYDHTKKQIVKAIGQHGDKSPDTAALVDFINRLGLPDSQLVIVHRDTLWHVTTCFAALQKAFAAVDVLEQETGLNWYSRG